MLKVLCFKCHKEHEFENKLGFRDECFHCGEDLHVCRNCNLYDAKAHNECRESSADRVREKERANYCDYFSARTGSGAGQLIDEQKAKQRAAAEALFKKKI